MNQEAPSKEAHEEIMRAADDHSFVAFFSIIQERVNKTAHDKGWYQSKLKDLLAEVWEQNLGPNESVEAELQGIEDARRLP